jgi:pyridoxine 5-phosphate synthase
MSKHTRLSVNINKLATLRNARGGGNPDILAWAKRIQQAGAHGITVHPRPDERHITRSDAHTLREVVDTEYNIEGYPSEAFIEMVIAIKPEQVTLVPDGPDVLTSNAGWDVIANMSMLQTVLARFKEAGIRTSLFTSTDLHQISAVPQTGADRIELYTESYALGFHNDKQQAVLPYQEAARLAATLELGVNAGHDLDLDNLTYFINSVKPLAEVSIGHALVCDSLSYGIENTISLYLKALHDTTS